MIIWLIIGAIAGWLAGQIVKGGGFGLIGDIIVGIVGAFIAGELFPFLGLRLGGGMDWRDHRSGHRSMYLVVPRAIGAQGRLIAIFLLCEGIETSCFDFSCHSHDGLAAGSIRAVLERVAAWRAWRRRNLERGAAVSVSEPVYSA